jgi:hypothetical protein
MPSSSPISLLAFPHLITKYLFSCFFLFPELHEVLLQLLILSFELTDVDFVSFLLKLKTHTFFSQFLVFYHDLRRKTSFLSFNRKILLQLLFDLIYFLELEILQLFDNGVSLFFKYRQDTDFQSLIEFGSFSFRNKSFTLSPVRAGQ